MSCFLHWWIACLKIHCYKNICKSLLYFSQYKLQAFHIFFTIQALNLCKYVLAETQNSCIWNYNMTAEQLLFFYNHCFSHQRLKFMGKYASTVLQRHQIVYILMHWLNGIPRKCKWLDFHARIVMISSCFILCSKEWQAPYRRIQASVMNILQKPQSCRCRSKLCSFIQVSPFMCCLPKNPVCRSW